MACDRIVLCERCNTSIQVNTATRTDGLCMPCWKATSNKRIFTLGGLREFITTGKVGSIDLSNILLAWICCIVMSPLLLIMVLFFCVSGFLCGLLEAIRYCYIELFIQSRFSHIENDSIVCKKHLFYIIEHPLNDIDSVRLIRYHTEYNVVLSIEGDELSFCCSIEKVTDLVMFLNRSVSQIVREDPYDIELMEEL